MVKEEVKAGAEYAFREKRVVNDRLQRIRLIEPMRGGWKAEWIEPNPGLVGYAASKQIVAQWEDHEDYLRDEASLAHLREYNRSSGHTSESPAYIAVEMLFESVGEGITLYKGILSSSAEALERITTRAQLVPYELKLPAYKDRRGKVYLPFDQALDLGQSFCKAEPWSVLTHIEAEERELSREASRPGEEYAIPLLNSYRPAWALLRQWCRTDASSPTREKQIDTLVRLLWDAIYALQKAGVNDEADRLRHVLEHG
jgi:hypothetical protein